MNINEARAIAILARFEANFENAEPFIREKRTCECCEETIFMEKAQTEMLDFVLCEECIDKADRKDLDHE